MLTAEPHDKFGGSLATRTIGNMFVNWGDSAATKRQFQGRANLVAPNAQVHAFWRRNTTNVEAMFLEKVAGVTGLEPATSGVTGRRSNQLSYTPL